MFLQRVSFLEERTISQYFSTDTAGGLGKGRPGLRTEWGSGEGKEREEKGREEKRREGERRGEARRGKGSGKGPALQPTRRPPGGGRAPRRCGPAGGGCGLPGGAVPGWAPAPCGVLRAASRGGHLPHTAALAKVVQSTLGGRDFLTVP